MYKLTIEGGEAGEFETFQDAFRVMYQKIKEMIEKGTSWQMLETTNWIEREIDGQLCPLMFYDARDLACDIGLLEDGKLQENPLVPADEEVLIMAAFINSGISATIEIQETVAKIARLRR